MKDKSFLIWICITVMQEPTATKDLKPIFKNRKKSNTSRNETKVSEKERNILF